MADRPPESLRMTRQRAVILDALREGRGHPTADEVFHAVRRRLPRVSLGTVYRNLDILAREGLIRRLDAEGGKMRFDGRPAAHDHVLCLGCGRMADVPAATLGRQEARAAEQAGYRIVGHRLEYLGYCPGCREGGRAKPTGAARLRGMASEKVSDTPGKKGSGVVWRNGPRGASHKRLLTPFSPSDTAMPRSLAAPKPIGPNRRHR